MNYTISDELLYRVLADVEAMYLQEIPQQVPEHNFSRRFEKRMQRLIKEERRSPQVQKAVTFSKRAILVLAALLVMAIGMVMSVEGLRVQFFKLVSETFEKYTAIAFDKNEAVSTEDSSFVQYELSYIPEGFSVESEICEPVTKVHYVVYSNKEGKVINLSQECLENVSTSINTEGVSQEKISINGFDGYCFSNIGLQSIYWYNNEYLFMVSSSLDRNTVLKIAESIRIKN